MRNLLVRFSVSLTAVTLLLAPGGCKVPSLSIVPTPTTEPSHTLQRIEAEVSPTLDPYHVLQTQEAIWTVEHSPTITPTPLVFVPDSNTYCLQGPNPVFKSVGRAMTNQTYAIEGRDGEVESESDIIRYKDGEDGVNRTRPGNHNKGLLAVNWLFIRLPGTAGCWVPKTSGWESGDLVLLSVLASPPTPTPSPVPPKPTHAHQSGCAQHSSQSACAAAGCSWDHKVTGEGYCH